MTLAPLWRARLQALAAAIPAVWLGVAIAHGEMLWPALFAGALGGVLLMRLQPWPLSVVLLGAILFGYIVGNRGFAQLSLSNSLPLLPAEVVLMICGGILAVRSALARELPWRRDALNLIVLGWIALCLCRLPFDVRTFGAVALRDFATVYYAAFFFLAQAAGREAASRRTLGICLLVASFTLLAIQLPYRYFPGFFLDTLTLRGVPLIFYKGDLVGIFLAAGAVALFLEHEKRPSRWALAGCVLLIGGALATNNRASILGLVTVTGLLVLARRWRFAVLQALAGTFAAIIILFAAYVQNIPWERTPLHGIYERVVSLTDPLGERQYSGEETGSKGDNNRFRAIWWRAVFAETLETNPTHGLGFGHDLAGRFVRDYYPDASDEFTTRSPHNILLTLFGRSGIVGLLPFLVVFALIAVRTVQAARRDPETSTWWAAAWVILVSACFGVVLEGPMGAVVFWSLLGLGNAAFADLRAKTATTDQMPNVSVEMDTRTASIPTAAR